MFHHYVKEEDGLAILMTLLDEVFDISSNDQWLQRQLTNLLRQLLGSMLSDKMGQRMMEALDNYATGERIANLISQLRNSIWPHGYPAEPREPPTQEFLHLTSLLSRTKLIGSVPDDLKRLLGTNTTNQGIIRCVVTLRTFNA
jgi:sorting nexin-13